MAKNRKTLPEMEVVGKTVSYEKTERKGFLKKLGAIVTKTVTAVSGVLGGAYIGAKLGALTGAGVSLATPLAVSGNVALISGGPILAGLAVGAGVVGYIGGKVGAKVGNSLNKMFFPKEKKTTHIDYMRKDDREEERRIFSQQMEAPIVSIDRNEKRQEDEFFVVSGAA